MAGNVTPFRRPINWEKLRQDQAERVIQERVALAKGRNVIFTDHAQERMDERSITRADAFRVLRDGHCDEPKRNEKGDWEVLVTKKIMGNREAGVATVILTNNNTLIIKTVEWIDP